MSYNGEALCLTAGNGKYTIARTSNPGNGSWDISEVTFPFTPDVNSLTATASSLYILDSDGNLHSSTDGENWSACGVRWHSIIGGYTGSVLGIEQRSDGYYHAQYPASGNATKIPDNFPVDGYSALVIYTTEWSNESQAIMAGGYTADGTPTGATWGYDGKKWMEINRGGLPARGGMTLVPYFGYHTDTSAWIVIKASMWLAMGGRDADGNVHRDVYTSYDCGINWHRADELMQLPDYIPSFADAQGLVFDETLHARSSGSGWIEMPSRELPVWWRIATPASRAVTPISEWECPYIYLFGGTDDNGATYPTVWRGVINRLTFQPLQ